MKALQLSSEQIKMKHRELESSACCIYVNIQIKQSAAPFTEVSRMCWGALLARLPETSEPEAENTEVP